MGNLMKGLPGGQTDPLKQPVANTPPIVGLPTDLLHEAANQPGALPTPRDTGTKDTIAALLQGVAKGTPGQQGPPQMPGFAPINLPMIQGDTSKFQVPPYKRRQF